MKFIRSAIYHSSSPGLRKCPGTTLPEYSFTGRSNVGKSSLINLLTSRKKIARTSVQPGKTRTINHFLINGEWFLVDLPGYGYARGAREGKQAFASIVTEYLLHRNNLMCNFLLLDARHSPQKNDLDFIRWMGENQIPFALIFNKSDKIPVHKLEKNIVVYKKELLKTWEFLPGIFTVSVLKKTGHEKILDFIESTNSKLGQQK